MKDFGENEAASEPYTLPIKTSITTGYSQDFEAWPSGWFSGGTKDPWQWGKPTTGPKQAFTGDHVYATNLDSPYENQTDAHLSMPMIAVPESGPPFYNINTGMTSKRIMTLCIFMCSLRGRCCPSGSLHRQNKCMDKRRS